MKEDIDKIFNDWNEDETEEYGNGFPNIKDIRKYYITYNNKRELNIIVELLKFYDEPVRNMIYGQHFNKLAYDYTLNRWVKSKMTDDMSLHDTFLSLSYQMLTSLEFLNIYRDNEKHKWGNK